MAGLGAELRGHLAMPSVVIAIAALAMVAVEGRQGAGLVVLAIIVTTTLLLDVQLPRGGSVPIGSAVVIAAAEGLDPLELAFAMAFALVLCGPVFAYRHGPERAVRQAVAIAGAAAAATGAAQLASGVIGSRDDGSLEALACVAASGVAYLAVDFATRRFTGRALTGDRLSHSWPVYVALLSAAALLGMAYTVDPWVASVAAIPLFVTRFSFQRYSDARRTYVQTIQALSVVPELAGHAPLGHGERTAAYAVAIATELGFDMDARYQVETAARLHHIGSVSLPEPTPASSDGDTGRAGAQILRETGFLADVADLVEAVNAPFAAAPDLTARAAVVRVASAFDDFVEDDASRARGAVSLLLSRADDVARPSIEALRAVLERDLTIVDDAIARGAPLTGAAEAAAAGVRLAAG